MLFQDETITLLQVFYKIQFVYDFFKVPQEIKPPRQIGALSIKRSIVWGFFMAFVMGIPILVEKDEHYSFLKVKI